MSYDSWMPAKKNKTSVIGVRFDEDARKALDKEAQAKGLDTGAYIRMLVFTHPDRQKKKV
jgi:predicted DNA binding CopG/RHH family protein